MRRSAFLRIHPAVSLTLAAAILCLAFLTRNPFVGLILIGGALAFGGETAGLSFVFKRLLLALGVTLAMALTNPLISHRGVTVLFYLGRNAVTLEAALYGAVSGALLAGVFLWCEAFFRALPPDAPFRLLGRILPKTALVLSMATRFVPRLMERMREARLAQRAFHPDDTVKSAFSALQTGVALTLEESCEIAAGMEARGYGTGRRRAFTLYRFTLRDGAASLLILALAGLNVWGAAAGAFRFDLYPAVSFSDEWSWYAAPLLLSFIPALTERREKAAWRFSKLKN